MATPSFTIPRRKLTWLITGSSSGFGLSLTRIVQAGGHNVVATSRNPSKTPDLVKEIERKGGKWVQLDVDSRNTPEIIQQLEASGSHIDVLVNNAGFSVFAPIETATEDEIRSQMESMYFGPLRLIKAVIPYMRQRGFGTIVNHSSGAALQGADTMGPYAGAKAGLDGLTKVLANEIAAFNIRTLTVVLGTFNTNFGGAAIFGAVPLPYAYSGSMSENMIKWLKSGKVPINGDKDKAMQAVYEAVVGEGAAGGEGKEQEKFLPLGTDVTQRVTLVRDRLSHALEVFGEVTNGVSIDK